MNRRSPLLSDNSSSRLTSRPRRDPRRKTLTPATSYTLGKCNVPTDRAELACHLSLLCLSEKRNKISSPGDGRKRGDHIHHSRALTGQFLFFQKNQPWDPVQGGLRGTYGSALVAKTDRDDRGAGGGGGERDCDCSRRETLLGSSIIPEHPVTLGERAKGRAEDWAKREGTASSICRVSTFGLPIRKPTVRTCLVWVSYIEFIRPGKLDHAYTARVYPVTLRPSNKYFIIDFIGRMFKDRVYCHSFGQHAI